MYIIVKTKQILIYIIIFPIFYEKLLLKHLVFVNLISIDSVSIIIGFIQIYISSFEKIYLLLKNANQ